jgi:hypothetical protein
MCLVAMSGCSSNGQAAPSPSPSQVEIHLTQGNRIANVAALTKHSQTIVIGVAGSSTVTEIRGIPVTTTQVTVTKPLNGGSLAKAVAVSQIGSDQASAPDVAKLMKEGSTYLLFLAGEKSDGQQRIVVTGGDGIYEQRGDQYVYSGGPGSSLPQFLTSETLKSQIKGQP